MKHEKIRFFEKLFYNNKFLMVFSVVLAIILWAVVKVNYSETTTRTISDVKITLDTKLAAENDFSAFTGQNGLYADVEVSGKAYNINTYSLTRDDIQLDAASGYIDAPGYKTMNLSAKINEPDVNLVRISPSSVTVFFDRVRTETFNVEARLTNDPASLANSGYIIGQPVPSVNTVRVSGPATVLEKIEKVYFEATLDETALPLTSTTEVFARIAFDLDRERDAGYLTCENVGTDANPASVTIPVNRESTVETTVKFVNQPSFFDETPPKFSVSPQHVTVVYNADESLSPSFNVGTIDFRKLSNKVNTFTFQVDESEAALLKDEIQSFVVQVDLSNFSAREIDATQSNVVYLNQAQGTHYKANLSGKGLEKVKLIGPAASLSKITPEMLQIEINVSALNPARTGAQTIKITNISIASDEINDCWVYGSYKASVQMDQ